MTSVITNHPVLTVSLISVEIWSESTSDNRPEEGHLQKSTSCFCWSSLNVIRTRNLRHDDILAKLSLLMCVVMKRRLSCPLPAHLPHQHVCTPDCSSHTFNRSVSRLSTRNSTPDFPGYFKTRLNDNKR